MDPGVAEPAVLDVPGNGFEIGRKKKMRLVSHQEENGRW